MLRSASVAPSAACGNSWARNAKLAEMFTAMTVPLEFSPEGTALERGEDGVELGEVGAVCSFLPINQNDHRVEALLNVETRHEHLKALHIGLVDARLVYCVLARGEDLVLHVLGLKELCRE